MFVRALLSPHEFKPTPRGDGIQKQYRLTRDAHGNCIYTEVGEIKLTDYVNSFEAGCSLNAILERISLMPARSKFDYLQQTADGVSADLTGMPKNGTEAFIMLQKLKEDHPDIINRFASGETFDSIVKSFMPNVENNVAEVENNG